MIVFVYCCARMIYCGFEWHKSDFFVVFIIIQVVVESQFYENVNEK